MIRSFIQSILIFLARYAIGRFKPIIIAVSGSVGKTSTKEAIFCVLKSRYRVSRNASNLNTPIGASLAILGFELKADKQMKAGSKNPFFWLYIFAVGFWRAFMKNEFPEIIILEYAADKPGDIKFLARCFPPAVGVVTSVGEYPAHVEFYSTPQEVAKEKSQIIRNLAGNKKLAVLNYDDFATRNMASDVVNAEILTFGFSEGAVFRAADMRFLRDKETDFPRGQTFNIIFRGSVVPVRVGGGLGKGVVYAAVAAAAVAEHFDINILESSQALESFTPPIGRMNIIKGIKNSWIIDDSYNSSPLAAHAALDILKELPGSKKVAVLGDMLELGQYTEVAHRALGARAAEVADYLFVVGLRAKFIADEALSHGMPKEKIFIYDQAEPAGVKLQECIEHGAITLVKASRAMKFEKIVEEVRMIEEQKRRLDNGDYE